MALSETSQISICQILSIPLYDLTAQINLLGTRLTTNVQTAIEAQITLWNAGAGTETVKLHPKESNKGVETNPGSARSDIKSNIAILLERLDWCGSSGVTVRVQRG